MYNDEILAQLSNLTYLKTVKGCNITATSKKNKYNDIVKFYAQIDKNDVINKISFKATGCTHFLVYCNYFCSIVEGKNIKSALKIKLEDLEKFSPLAESRKHVAEVILGTFALLIKKYRKGVEKGTIIPIDSNESVSTKTTSKPTVKNAKHKKTEEESKKNTIDDSHHTKEDNVKHLSEMLDKINHKEDKSKTKSSKKTSSNQKSTSKDVPAENMNVDTSKLDTKKEKKGLFARFKKNK